MRRTNNSSDLRPLVEALMATIEPLDPQQADVFINDAALIVMARLPSAEFSDERADMSAGLQALAGKLPAATAQIIARSFVHELNMTSHNPYFRQFFAPGLEASVRRMEEPALIELLKYRLCVEAAREIVLQELGRRRGQSFPTLWQFVSWAEQQSLPLDLRSPLRQ